MGPKDEFSVKLKYAIIDGNVTVARRLIKGGVDVNKSDQVGSVTEQLMHELSAVVYINSSSPG